MRKVPESLETTHGRNSPAEADAPDKLRQKYGAMALRGVPDVKQAYRWGMITNTEQFATAVHALQYAGFVYDDPTTSAMISEIREIYFTQFGTGVTRLLTGEQREILCSAVAELASASVAELDTHEDPSVRRAALFVSNARWLDGWRLPQQPTTFA